MKVFEDSESGISHYFWSIGSNHGYEDIMQFTYSDEECAETNKDTIFELQDGHACYITVMVVYFLLFQLVYMANMFNIVPLCSIILVNTCD